jgi:hypothetical protein
MNRYQLLGPDHRATGGDASRELARVLRLHPLNCLNKPVNDSLLLSARFVLRGG